MANRVSQISEVVIEEGLPKARLTQFMQVVIQDNVFPVRAAISQISQVVITDVPPLSSKTVFIFAG